MENINNIVRVATPWDEKSLVDLFLKAWEENGITSVDVESIVAMLRPALYLWEGIVGAIGEPGGRIEGATLLRYSKMWYSSDWLLEEKILFVDPEFRAKGKSNSGSTRKVYHAKELCEFAKKTANELNMPLMIGVLSNERTASKVRLYERSFGPSAGAFFLYGTHTGQAMEH